METIKAKNYGETFLYGKVDYERKLINFLTSSDEIDKKSDRFQDIAFDVKRRQVTTSLYNVLMSDSVVLLANAKPLPKSFKVFVAKDIRSSDKKDKVFIDVSEIIKTKNGLYHCTNVDVLIAYLVSAMNCRIYYADPRRILTNNNLLESGTEIFVDLFTFVLDHLNLSGLSVSKTKCEYLAAMYFQCGILAKEMNDTTINRAVKISKISDRDLKVINLLVEEIDFLNIDRFIKKISTIMNIEKFTTDVFIEKWIYLYGPSTHFACEIYPAFATMIINAYCGVYLNNQKTIEKRIGNNLTKFVNAIFVIGADAI